MSGASFEHLVSLLYDFRIFESSDHQEILRQLSPEEIERLTKLVEAVRAASVISEEDGRRSVEGNGSSFITMIALGFVPLDYAETLILTFKEHDLLNNFIGGPGRLQILSQVFFEILHQNVPDPLFFKYLGKFMALAKEYKWGQDAIDKWLLSSWSKQIKDPSFNVEQALLKLQRIGDDKILTSSLKSTLIVRNLDEKKALELIKILQEFGIPLQETSYSFYNRVLIHFIDKGDGTSSLKSLLTLLKDLPFTAESSELYIYLCQKDSGTVSNLLKILHDAGLPLSSQILPLLETFCAFFRSKDSAKGLLLLTTLQQCAPYSETTHSLYLDCLSLWRERSSGIVDALLEDLKVLSKLCDYYLSPLMPPLTEILINEVLFRNYADMSLRGDLVQPILTPVVFSTTIALLKRLEEEDIVSYSQSSPSMMLHILKLLLDPDSAHNFKTLASKLVQHKGLKLSPQTFLYLLENPQHYEDFFEKKSLRAQQADSNHLFVALLEKKITQSKTALESSLFPEGPLVKTTGTRYLESVLAALAQCPAKEIRSRFNEWGECEITFNPTGSSLPITVNIHLLLRNTDLTQLIYDPAHLNLDHPEDPFSTILKGLCTQVTPLLDTIGIRDSDVPEGEGPLKFLPRDFKKLIFAYTSEQGPLYQKVNALFRGVEKDEQHAASYFMLGILVTYAINTLPLLWDQTPEKKLIEDVLKWQKRKPDDMKLVGGQLSWKEVLDDFTIELNTALKQKKITQEQYSLLRDQRENLLPLLAEGGYPAVYRLELPTTEDQKKGDRLLGAPVGEVRYLMALTSTSTEANLFKPDLPSSESVRSNITLTSPSWQPSIASLSKIPGEQELLISPGTPIIIEHTADKATKGRIIFSPALQRNDYWVEHAMRYAYHEHFNKEYADNPGDLFQLTPQDKPIYRPNHALVHHVRSLSYIPLLLDYFGAHAKDPEFRKFCHQIRQGPLEEMLKIASMFAATGRESEASFRSSDPEEKKAYQRYRTASAEHFQTYTSAFPEMLAQFDETTTITQAFKSMVLHLGNPNYPQEGNPAETGSVAWKNNNWLYCLLSTAHKLDLKRCYPPHEYHKVMEYTEPFSQNSPEQKHDFDRLQAYVTQLIEKTGEEVCQGDQQGTRYNKLFCELSHSPPKLVEAIRLVPLPVMGNLHSDHQEMDTVFYHPLGQHATTTTNLPPLQR